MTTTFRDVYDKPQPTETRETGYIGAAEAAVVCEECITTDEEIQEGVETLRQATAGTAVEWDRYPGCARCHTPIDGPVALTDHGRMREVRCALDALVVTATRGLIDWCLEVLAHPEGLDDLRGQVYDALARLDEDHGQEGWEAVLEGGPDALEGR